VNEILVFTPKVTNRLTYTFDLLLSDLLGLKPVFTSSEEEFNVYEGNKISYSLWPLGNELFFEATKLLYEDVIEPQSLEVIDYNGLPGMYEVANKQSAFPFDIFATTFFLISRYEEILPHKIDKHGRYRVNQSVASKHNFLDKPVINHYAIEIKKALTQKFPGIKFKESKFEYVPTFDIDMAFCFKHKGMRRNLGGFFKSFMFANFKDVRDRFMVLFGGRKDPFDTYDYIEEVCAENGLRPIYFFLLGQHSQYNKNLNPQNTYYKELIRDISKRADTGIHLSYEVHGKRKTLEKEKLVLRNIIEKDVFRNRYHYLKFELPYSYMRLVKHDIVEDYSMGYAARTGFRASICSPFYYFNLKENMATNLRVFPFAFMDTTLNEYNKLYPEEAQKKINKLMDAVKEVNGSFYGLWHNSSLSNYLEWEGWTEVFENTAKRAKQLQHHNSE
jgi:hypothetical protein